MSRLDLGAPSEPASGGEPRRVVSRSGRLYATYIGLGLAGVAVLALLVWVSVTANGVPNPGSKHLTRGAVILDSGLLVFREGLEMILVLAAVTASFVGAHESYRRPVASGAGVGFAASVVTWFVAIAVIDRVNAPALEVQAATGLLAIAVLLVIMNWFFHKVYWTGWISHHTARKRRLLELPGDARTRLLLGLGLLGFTAVYREGFEVVLFLQTLRLQAGDGVVLEGVALGLLLTIIAGVLTFAAHQRLPYKRMLVLTGMFLGVVLVVMVGESAYELEQAGWMSTTPVPLPLPDWMGVWFAVYPILETLAAQALAAAFVIGSYELAEYLRVSRPRRLGTMPAHRPEHEPRGL
jgi:high-affinity iron transporter